MGGVVVVAVGLIVSMVVLFWFLLLGSPGQSLLTTSASSPPEQVQSQSQADTLTATATTILPNISFSESESVSSTVGVGVGVDNLPTVTALAGAGRALPDGGYLDFGFGLGIPNPVSTPTSQTAAAGSNTPPATTDASIPNSGSDTGQATATPQPASQPAAIPIFPPVTAVPAKLTIAAIGISGYEIRPVGLEMVKLPSGKRTQQWQALDYNVGYHTSPPSQICKWGLTVLNGHNWWRYKPGVFVNLHKAKPGDLIEATDSQGSSCSYKVDEVKQYGPLDTSWLGDTSQIYDLASSHLVLYTCSQDFQDRIVVKASLVR